MTRHSHHLGQDSGLGCGKAKFRSPFHFYIRRKKWILKKVRTQIRLQNVEQNTFERIAENIFILSFTSQFLILEIDVFQDKSLLYCQHSLLYLLHIGRYSFSKLSYTDHTSNYKIHFLLILLQHIECKIMFGQKNIVTLCVNFYFFLLILQQRTNNYFYADRLQFHTNIPISLLKVDEIIFFRNTAQTVF